MFQGLCRELEGMLGRVFTDSDLRCAYTIYDHLGLPPEVIPLGRLIPALSFQLIRALLIGGRLGAARALQLSAGPVQLQAPPAVYRLAHAPHDAHRQGGHERRNQPPQGRLIFLPESGRIEVLRKREKVDAP